MVHRRSCSVACGILLDQESNPCLLYWQADSSPLGQQESPSWYVVAILSLFFYSKSLSISGLEHEGSHHHKLPQLKPRSYTYTHQGEAWVGMFPLVLKPFSSGGPKPTIRSEILLWSHPGSTLCLHCLRNQVQSTLFSPKIYCLSLRAWYIYLYHLWYWNIRFL